MHRTEAWLVASAKGLAMLALVLGLIACVEPPKRPLRVGLLVWPPYELFFLARHHGDFGETPIELIDFSANADLTGAFESRTIDAFCVTTDLYLDELGADSDARIVMVVDVSAGADALVAQPGIESIEGLKGRRVGLSPSSLGVYVVSRALESAGLSLKDVELQYLDEIEQFDAFTTGRVDAVAAYEPTVTELVKAGGIRLFDSSSIPDEIVDVLIVHKEFIDRDPAAVQALVNGFLRARTRLIEQPRESAAVLAPREGISSEDFLQSFEGVRLPDLEENRRMLSGVDPPLTATMRRVAAVLRAAGSLRLVPNLDGTIDARFVEATPP